MKNIVFTLIVLSLMTMKSYGSEPVNKAPVNYTIVLDLSDRVLEEGQLMKDKEMIVELFNQFEKNARRGLILTSKDRFTVKIVPQKGSPLDVNYFENMLQLKLDEIQIQYKNTATQEFSSNIRGILDELFEKSTYGNRSNDYFGVDLWAYFNDNAKHLKRDGYENVVVIFTDGYFDFESTKHILNNNNRSTATRFLRNLNKLDWKEKAQKEDYGLIPIKLCSKTKFIVAGIKSKNENDILQNQKIIYFWEKWLKESGATRFNFILSASANEMKSQLIQNL